LQKKDLDISVVVSSIKNLKAVLRQFRVNADARFSKIFQSGHLVLDEMDVEIKIPRLANRHTNRSNVPAETAE
jgi:hypothetical protein